MLEKKKGIWQKAEIRKHHNYLWAYKNWIYTVLAFLSLLVLLSALLTWKKVDILPHLKNSKSSIWFFVSWKKLKPHEFTPCKLKDNYDAFWFQPFANSVFFMHFLACKLKWWGVGFTFMSLKKVSLCFSKPILP